MLNCRGLSSLFVGTKLTEFKVDEEAVATIAMEVGVAKREAEIVRPQSVLIRFIINL